MYGSERITAKDFVVLCHFLDNKRVRELTSKYTSFVSAEQGNYYFDDYQLTEPNDFDAMAKARKYHVYAENLPYLFSDYDMEELRINREVLIEVKDLPESHILRKRLEQTLERDCKDSSNILHCLAKDFKFIPTYRFFCNNLTGDVFSRLTAKLERMQRPFSWNDQFIEPQRVQTINILDGITLKIFCEYEQGLAYYDASPDGKYRIVTDAEYNTQYKDYQNSPNDKLKTRYIITKSELDKASKEALKVFLQNKQFPYEKTFKEYCRFLENMEYFLKLDGFSSSVENEYIDDFNYYMFDFLKLLVPSKVSPQLFVNHTHIVGRSGSGKSEFLKSIIRQLRTNCILIDPHGDIADSLNQKQNFFKIAPTERRFVINPFDIEDKSLDNRELVTEEIIQLLQEIIKDTSVSALMKTISYPIVSTLLKLPYADFKMFADCIRPTAGVDLLQELTPYVDEHLKNIWEDLKTDTYDTTKRSIFGRLQSFLNKKRIVDTVCGFDDFNEAIQRVESGENLVVSLPISKLGDEVTEVIGRFFMCRMQIWAKRRQSIPERQRTEVFLIVDECQNFLSNETARTLDQFGRKFGLYMTLAHQHIGQIDGRELKGSILANCKNKIIGYADNATNQTMAKAIEVETEDFSGLTKGYFYAKFEDREPFKFYSKLARFKTVFDEIQYAQSKNSDYIDGWEINHRPSQQPTSSENTTNFKPKYST